MEQDIVKVSSRGQIVIPKELRDETHIKDGDVLLVTKLEELLVLKKLDTSISEEDLWLVKEAEKGWKEIKEGRFKRMGRKDFLEELEKW